MTDEELDRPEIEAVLETRRELGLRYDAELVDGFADRIERVVEKRVSADVARRRGSEASQVVAGQRQLALAIVSLVAAIPISIPLGLQGKYPALLIALIAIMVVNLAHAWQSKRDR